MPFVKHLIFLLVLCTSLLALPAAAFECQTGTKVEHTFDSGANWRFCAVLDDDHALELQNLHYQAPGDESRKVLQHLHLGQLLLHHHDQTEARELIGERQLGGSALQILNSRVCNGDLITIEQRSVLCSVVRPTGLLAKYRRRPGLQGEQYQLFSVSEIDGFTFQIKVGLSEDGRINPAVVLSGRSSSSTTNPLFGDPLVNPLDGQQVIGTQTTVLYTWRMVFTLNGDQGNDQVEEFNFTLEPTLSDRRPMQVTSLSTEALRNVAPERFRGWRVKDVDGRGYYLDPQNSGYRFSDNNNNWTQFDFALTSFDTCEQHSRITNAVGERDTMECIGSLDDYVNGGSIDGSKPVIWYSISRVHRPSAEDYPIISSMISDFELVPFDWTSTSPFEVIIE